MQRHVSGQTAMIWGLLVACACPGPAESIFSGHLHRGSSFTPCGLAGFAESLSPFLHWNVVTFSLRNDPTSRDPLSPVRSAATSRRPVYGPNVPTPPGRLLFKSNWGSPHMTNTQLPLPDFHDDSFPLNDVSSSLVRTALFFSKSRMGPSLRFSPV